LKYVADSNNRFLRHKTNCKTLTTRGTRPALINERKQLTPGSDVTSRSRIDSMVDVFSAFSNEIATTKLRDRVVYSGLRNAAWRVITEEI